MSFTTHYRIAEGEDRRALCGDRKWISLISIIERVDCDICKVLMLAKGIEPNLAKEIR